MCHSFTTAQRSSPNPSSVRWGTNRRAQQAGQPKKTLRQTDETPRENEFHNLSSGLFLEVSAVREQQPAQLVGGTGAENFPGKALPVQAGQVPAVVHMGVGEEHRVNL